jgi:hypothetical protein
MIETTVSIHVELVNQTYSASAGDPVHKVVDNIRQTFDFVGGELRCDGSVPVGGALMEVSKVYILRGGL